jgi:Protein of unknown function (DUF1778)
MAKQARAAVLTLRISDEEQEQLRRAAEDRHLSVSEYVRSMVREGQQVIPQGPMASLGDQTFTSSRGGSQRGGGDFQLHGSAWVINGPGQFVDGHTMTVLVDGE